MIKSKEGGGQGEFDIHTPKKEENKLKVIFVLGCANPIFAHFMGVKSTITNVTFSNKQ